MRVLTVTDDAALAKRVRDNLDAARVGLRHATVGACGPLSPAGLVLVDEAALPRVDLLALAARHTPRGLLRDAEAPTILPSPPFDFVLSWPSSTERLATVLERVAETLRDRKGVAGDDIRQAGLERVAELMSDSVEIVDTQVRMLHVNPAFTEITGWTLEDAVGHTTGELFRAGTHDASYYAQIMQTLRAGRVWRGPLIGRRRDGELSFQEATLAPVLGSDGAARAFVAIKRDIARDALVQAAMDSTERRLQTMLEGAGDGFFVHDPEGVLADANPVACAMLGLERSALVAGRRLSEFIEGVTETELLVAWRTLSPGQPRTIEVRLTRPDGRATAVSLRIAAFVFGGERFILTLARDITERVALEQELRARSEELARSLDELRAAQRELVEREKLAALGALVAGVAHEINTPLGVSLMALSLAEEHLAALRAALAAPVPSRKAVFASAEGLAETLALATANGRRAATLVTDFKKVAVDQTSEVERPVELGRYVEGVIGTLSPMLRTAGVQVEFGAEPVTLTTRPGAIAQIVINVLQNAVIHAFDEAHGDRVVRVRVTRKSDSAVIELADRGRGMPADLRARIFDPFVSTRLGSGGSGLGMHIVHTLVVQVLRGSVAVQSAPGEGTCVTVKLPMA